MLANILEGPVKKNYRNMRAIQIKGFRKTGRIARKIKNFFIPSNDQAPGDNFPPAPLGLK